MSNLLNHPEALRLAEWLTAERVRGLLDLKVSRTNERCEPTDLLTELNAALSVPVVPDSDFF